MWRPDCPGFAAACLVIAVASLLALHTNVRIERYDLGLSPASDGYPEASSVHQPVPIRMSTLSGLQMKAVYYLLKTPLIGDILAYKARRDNGYDKVRSFAASVETPNPLFYPYTTPSEDAVKRGGDGNRVDLRELLAGRTSSTVLSLHEEFLNQHLSPVILLQRVLRAIADSDSDLHAFVHVDEGLAMQAAFDSAERFSRGAPLSVLDGVPIAVKVELEVKGMPHSMGLAHLKDHIGTRDDITVAKLRAAGAVIVGVTNMYEYGMGTSGFNPLYGATRNPHNLSRHSGGSSGGSAAAVAAGLVPIAIGTDGGGSIRIPSALCGVVGLKPTFFRVPTYDATCFTVCHVGPIARSVDDAMIAYQLLAARGDEGPARYHPQPLPSFTAVTRSDLTDLRIGVISSGLSSSSSSSISQATSDAVDKLVARGARLIPIAIPFSDVVFNSHTVTVISELAATLSRHSPQHMLSYPGAISIEFARRFSQVDYIAAQIVRRWMYEKVQQVFTKVDVVITPATGITAPEVCPASATGEGEVELKSTAELVRFMLLSNFVGTPAMVVPVARGSDGMPIALQLIAGHWNEAVLFRMGRLLEERVPPMDVDFSGRVIGGQ